MGFGFFPSFSELLVQCAKILFPGGWGGCVYFLKSVRKDRCRNVWVGGGGVGDHIFEHRAANGTMYTKHAKRRLDHLLFGFRAVVIVAPLHKGWDLIGAHTPLLVNGIMFLRFSPILQPVRLHRHSPRVERHGPQAAVLSMEFVVVISFCGQLQMLGLRPEGSEGWQRPHLL